MNNEIWMVIALVEFIILVVMLGSKFSRNIKLTRYNVSKGRMGVIRDRQLQLKGIQHSKVTIFEIQESNGNIVYAAIDEWVNDLEVGNLIEFWLSKESIARILLVHKYEEDGFTRRMTGDRLYYGLSKYRIIEETANEG